MEQTVLLWVNCVHYSAASFHVFIEIHSDLNNESSLQESDTRNVYKTANLP